ncbi:MAG: hypothetical protein ACI4C1_00480 [Lachnospiraceae bacterium]
MYLNLDTDKEICITENAAVPDYSLKTLTYPFTVEEDGVTYLNIRGTGDDTLAINLNYIVIRQKIEEKTSGDVENTDSTDEVINDKDNSGGKFGFVIIIILVILIAGGVVTACVIRKRREERKR